MFHCHAEGPVNVPVAEHDGAFVMPDSTEFASLELLAEHYSRHPILSSQPFLLTSASAHRLDSMLIRQNRTPLRGEAAEDE